MTASPLTAYEKAEDREERIRSLVIEHLPLARRIVGRISVSLGPTVSRDDMYSAATLGLVEAAHRYDPTKGAKFETFAYLRIKGAVMDCLRDSDWLGKSARDQLSKLREHIQQFRSRHARRPGIEELSSRTGLPEDDILRLLSYEKWDSVASLQDNVGSGQGGGAPLGSLLASNAVTPLEKLQKDERVDQLVFAIESLPERQKQIIIMYYYEDLYMSEMADILGVSESRISQLHTRAIYNLTRMLESGDE